MFVTNNATQSRKMYVKKFERLGVEAYVVRAFPPPRDGRKLTWSWGTHLPGSGCIGRDLRVGVRVCSIHLLGPAAAEGQESVCGRNVGTGGGAQGRRRRIPRRNSARLPLLLPSDRRDGIMLTRVSLSLLHWPPRASTVHLFARSNPRTTRSRHSVSSTGHPTQALAPCSAALTRP